MLNTLVDSDRAPGPRCNTCKYHFRRNQVKSLPSRSSQSQRHRTGDLEQYSSKSCWLKQDRGNDGQTQTEAEGKVVVGSKPVGYIYRQLPSPV